MANEKTLTPAEVEHLQNLVAEVLNVVANDDTGVTVDLGEKAEVAAEILGLNLGGEDFDAFDYDEEYLDPLPE
jgi:hypothetical protein